jgi:anti-sigma factor RsiW
MSCDEVRDAIEPLAAGDMAVAPAVAAHLASCAACAAEFEAARQVEQLLRARPAPHAPAGFTGRTLARVRHARWRSEQRVDLAFNLGLGIAGILIIVGFWIALRQSGLEMVAADLAQIFIAAGAAATRQIAAALPLYGAASALLAGALALWWWSERGIEN